MKITKFILYFSLITFLLISCNTETKKKVSQKELDSENIAMQLEIIQLDIKGMTCEIGCARLIQSKLSKKEGVKVAIVSFKDNIGEVSYNSSILSKKEIIQVIESIADGTLYKVTGSKEINVFTFKK